MNKSVAMIKESKSKAVANSIGQKKDSNQKSLWFINNELKIPAQQKLQEKADNSPVVTRFKNYHQLVNRYPLGISREKIDTKPIQRMVLNLDPEDPIISQSADVMIKRAQSKSSIMESYSDPTLWEKGVSSIWLGEDEELTIVAHGTPVWGGDEPKFANRTALELFNTLISQGFSKANRGTIHLAGCTTAWARRGEKSFGERFKEVLQYYGFSNKVTGHQGFLSTYSVDEEKETKVEYGDLFLSQLLSHRYVKFLSKFSDPFTEETKKIPLVPEMKKERINLYKEFFALKKIDAESPMLNFYAKVHNLLLRIEKAIKANGINHKKTCSIAEEAAIEFGTLKLKMRKLLPSDKEEIDAVEVEFN